MHTDVKKYNSALFLDRDGVINREKNNDYILSWEDFTFYEGVLEACRIFATHFDHIVVVTNQRCVGRGLLSEADLGTMHERMTQHIHEAGGRIDKIYAATALDMNDPYRKPKIGMALEAQKDFPHIDPKRSLMVGNKVTDLIFGSEAGFTNILLTTTNPELRTHPLVYQAYPSLLVLAHALSAQDVKK